MTRKFAPSLPYESMPVKWWLLINELEEFRARTGWGLAAVWALVHKERYEQARERFDQLQKEFGHLKPGYCECGHPRSEHDDGLQCQGVQISGGHITDCGCRAYVYSQGHTAISSGGPTR